MIDLICGLMEKHVSLGSSNNADVTKVSLAWLKNHGIFQGTVFPHKSFRVKTNGICLETLKYSFSTVCCNDFGYLRRDIRLWLRCLYGTPGEQRSSR